jgi:type VI secretion system protein ImpK
MALIDCFLPPLAFAAMLGSEPSMADTPYATARADMDRLLDQAMEKARMEHPHQADNALFAVCAFADEAILDSAWPGRKEWMHHKLQQIRFQSGNAGVEFYQRMEMLCAGPARAGAAEPDPDAPDLTLDDSRREVLEVYAACLTLGFKGQYSNDQVRIDRLAGSTLQQLLADSGWPENKVFPETYAGALPAAKVPRLKPALRMLIFFSAPLLVAAVLYTSYAFLLSTFVRRWMEALG